MQTTRKINEDILYLGIDDRRLSRFENLFPLDRGVTYNSYLIRDTKTALLDTVDQTVEHQFWENLQYALQGRPLDYLIVNHMEPDHCAMIRNVLECYPEAVVVATAKTFQMILQYFDLNLPDERKRMVKEGDTLSLGKHRLKFVMAPMVHWPEVMFTYDETDKALFSADAFGIFGTNNGNLFNDEQQFRAKDFVDDARRYYANIVGKYGPQVQAALRKLSGLEISLLCPLHGPVWRSDFDYIIGLYERWSKYEAEEQGVVAFYNSVYGNTESVINGLLIRLAERGIKNIRAYDVSKTDVSYLIAEAYRVTNLIIGATTYNNGLFPKMENLVSDMKAVAVQNKKVSIVENGSWAPAAAKILHEEFDGMKNMSYIGETLTIRSAQYSKEALDTLADAIAESLKG